MPSPQEKEGFMVDFCVYILSFFLIPFQTVFMQSVLGAFVFILLVSLPVTFLSRVFRSF